MTTPPSKSRATSAGASRNTGSGEVDDDESQTADSDPAGRLLDRVRDARHQAEKEGAAKSGSSPAPPAAIAPGVRVRVLRGPFAEKSGVVQELDGRGGARVMLGLLSARIDLTDLAATAAETPVRERMTLSSSHRKPR